jgi:hypothetical protein
MRRTALGAPPAVAVLLALVGCGGLDTEKAERNIRNGIEAETSSVIKSVSCPDDVEQKEGVVFRCTATTSEGRTLAVDVTQTDDNGGIVWRTSGRTAEATTGPTGPTGATGGTAATGATGPGPLGGSDRSRKKPRSRSRSRRAESERQRR